jgi:hypothetical protein
MRTFLAVSTAAAVGVLAAPAVAYAHTGGTTPCHAKFTDHPENSSPPWALDTYTRVTSFRDNHDGTWKAHIRDFGHFTTIPGTKSDSGDTIANKVTGTLTGSGDYTVTSKSGPHCPSGEHYTGAGGQSTGQWPVHYFGEGATTGGIDPWRWLYKTCREYMVEDSVKGTVGSIAGKPCRARRTPTPTPTTPTPTETSPAPIPTPTGTTPPGEAPVPTPVHSDLPVAG